MKHGNVHEHVSAERLQAFLEGEVLRQERGRIEEHLAVCARCSAEHDAWKILFEDLHGLAAHRPHEGFADRVMANVQVPTPRPHAARVRGSVGDALPSASGAHVEESVLQDFLDGVLGGRRAASVQTHLASCGSCASQADSWLNLLARLDGLERLAPTERFAERVMAGVTLPEPVPTPLAARVVLAVRSAVAGLRPRPASVHLASELLQDLSDGTPSKRAVARARAHLAMCGECSHELEAWRALSVSLAGLPRWSPADGFAERVMAGVRIPSAATPVASAPARAPATAPIWAPALALARRLVPRTRRAWAALSGMAVTPAVTVALMLYAVFSHPTLTLEGLASFVWWQVSDVAAIAWTALATAAVDSVQLFGLYSLVVGAITSAPLAIAGGVVAYGLVCALALRVLYKNLVPNRPLNGRYAHASAS